MENVLILGSGCAGLTAAIYTARAGLNPLVLEGPQPGGQLTTTSEVENFPGFPEGIDGFELMDHLRKQAKRFGTRFAYTQIKTTDLSPTRKRLSTAGGEAHEARALIVATGASPRRLDIPGESEMWGGKGVSSCATCDGAFYRDQAVVVVGGGDTAAEEALFLTRFASKVTLVHRRNSLRASNIMAQRVLENPKIEVVWDTVCEAVLAGDDGRTRAVQVRHRPSDQTSEIPCTGFFLAIGHIPNTAAFAGQLPLDEEGYFKPRWGSQVLTDVPGVYVAGDCVDHVYRQAITAAGMGCQAAIEAERWLAQLPEAGAQTESSAASTTAATS